MKHLVKFLLMIGVLIALLVLMFYLTYRNLSMNMDNLSAYCTNFAKNEVDTTLSQGIAVPDEQYQQIYDQCMQENANKSNWLINNPVKALPPSE